MLDPWIIEETSKKKRSGAARVERGRARPAGGSPGHRSSRRPAERRRGRTRVMIITSEQSNSCTPFHFAVVGVFVFGGTPPAGRHDPAHSRGAAPLLFEDPSIIQGSSIADHLSFQRSSLTNDLT